MIGWLKILWEVLKRIWHLAPNAAAVLAITAVFIMGYGTIKYGIPKGREITSTIKSLSDGQKTLTDGQRDIFNHINQISERDSLSNLKMYGVLTFYIRTTGKFTKEETLREIDERMGLPKVHKDTVFIYKQPVQIPVKGVLIDTIVHKITHKIGYYGN